MSSLSYYKHAQRKYCTAVQKKRHAQSQTRWTRRKQTSQDAQPKTAPRSRQPAKVPRPVHPRPRITPLPAHMKPTPYHQTPRPSIQSTHECATVTCVLSHATPEALSRSLCSRLNSRAALLPYLILFQYFFLNKTMR